MSDGFQALQMAFRLFVLCFGLYERDGRGIKVLSRNCALSEQVLAAVVNLLLRIKVLLGGAGVSLRLLQFLGHPLRIQLAHLESPLQRNGLRQITFLVVARLITESAVDKEQAVAH